MIICKNCSYQNNDDDAFCGSCGAFLEWSGERLDEPEVEPQPEPEPAQEVAAPAPAVSAPTSAVPSAAGDLAPTAVSEAEPTSDTNDLTTKVNAWQRQRAEALARRRAETEAEEAYVEPKEVSPAARPAGATETTPAAKADTVTAAKPQAPPRPHAGADVSPQKGSSMSLQEALAQKRAEADEVEADEVEAERAVEAEVQARADEEAAARAKADKAAQAVAEAKAQERARGEVKAQIEATAATEAEPGTDKEAQAPARDAEAARRAAALLVKPASPAPRPPTRPDPSLQRPSPSRPQPQPAPQKTPPSREPKPGDQICSQCGEGNDSARRFCRRCGASLVKSTVVPSSPTVSLPWWKRLFSRKSTVDAASGGRSMYRSRRRIGERVSGVFRVTAAITALVMVLGYLGPLRRPVNQWISGAAQSVHRLFNPNFVQVRPIPPTDANDNAAVDGGVAFWEGQTLTLTFDRPVDLDRIRFISGVPEDNSRPRPERVILTFSDGSTENLTLNDTLKAQDHNIKARDVTNMTLQVVSTFPTGGSSATISEIFFFRKA